MPISMCMIHAYMHTCMHACMHACIHTYTHTHIHACMPACLPACMHTYIYIYIYNSVCICTCVCVLPGECRGIPRRSGSQGVLGVLRFFALFCGRLPLVCGRFASICGRFLFLGVCGNLRAFVSKTGSMPRMSRNSLTFESPGM